MNTTTKITTNASDLRGDLAPLYYKYPQQTNSQPGRITIYPDDYRAVADYNPEIGNAVTFAEWHHRILTVSVNESVKGSALADMLDSEEFQALAERICDGHSVEWDGNNNVGRLTEDAEGALEELQSLADGLNDESAEIWSVGNWLDASTYPAKDHSHITITDLPNITAQTTDEELQEMVDTIKSWAEEASVEFEDDVMKYLESWRDWCAPQEDEDDE